jgi:hypothetical protein
MKTGRPERGVCLSSEEKEQLQSIVSSLSPRHGLLTRVRIVRLAAQGGFQPGNRRRSASVPSPSANGSGASWTRVP